MDTIAENENKGLGQTLFDLFKKLPAKIQSAINEMRPEERVASIAKDYNLQEKEIILLQNELLKVLLVVIDEEEFHENLRRGLSINESQMDSLLRELDEKIFKPIESGLPKEDSLLKNSTIDVVNIDLEEKIKKIGEKNGLHVDEMGILREEIKRTISGSLPNKDFPNKIKAELGLNDEKTDLIIKDINSQIFNNIKTLMIGRSREKEREEAGHEESNLSREEILKEIERDDENHTQIDNKPENNLDEEEVKSQINNEKDFLQENIETTEGTATKVPIKKISKAEEPLVESREEIFEDKLSKSVLVNEESKNLEQPSKNIYKGSIDPYREQVD